MAADDILVVRVLAEFFFAYSILGWLQAHELNLFTMVANMAATFKMAVDKILIVHISRGFFVFSTLAPIS